MTRERILRELALLREGGQLAELVSNGRESVIYRQVPTGGARLSLPETTDVIVPVPAGYPASPIDLAGLPAGSPFLPRVKGGENSQGVYQISGVTWSSPAITPIMAGEALPGTRCSTDSTLTSITSSPG